jgi:DNA-binding MarR family transcriptional regulator
MALGTPPAATAETIAAIDHVRRLARRASAAMDGELEELGLTSAQVFFLETVAGAPREHIAEIARTTRTSRQAADRLARQLVRSDLIRLMPVDLGVRGLVVTDTGHRRIRLAREAVASALAPIDDVLDEGERTALARSAERAAIALRPRPLPWWFG